jgi:hypothetical protein
VQLLEHVDRFRYVPLAMGPRLWPPYRRRLDDYAARTARVYRAVAEVSGAEVVVDSSKSPSFAVVAGRIPDLPVRLLHLVRDSRGVAFSWRRRVRRPETGDGSDMPTYSPARIAVEWMLWNSVFELLGARWPRTRVHYESLMEDPRRDLQRVAVSVGGPTDRVAYAFVSAGVVNLGVHHTVSGNRVRSSRGALRLRVDSEWLSRITRRDRTLVSLLTWPLLLGYGYLTPPTRPGRGGPDHDLPARQRTARAASSVRHRQADPVGQSAGTESSRVARMRRARVAWS